MYRPEYCQNLECQSCLETPEAGFRLERWKKGDKFNIEDHTFYNIIFVTKGEILIDSVECHDFLVKQREMVFCNKFHLYNISVKEDAEVVYMFFNTMGASCDKMSMPNIQQAIDSIDYQFISLPINKALHECLISLIIYLREGIACNHMHRAKVQEVFIIFKFYYPSEDALRLFYKLFNRDMNFLSSVMKHAPTARTAEELAQLCGYSISRFKVLFRAHFDTTPYAWLLRYRMQFINRQLCDANIPIKQIITDFNFTDHSHFSRYCRQYFGDTPSNIRKANKTKYTQNKAKYNQ